MYLHFTGVFFALGSRAKALVFAREVLFEQRMGLRATMLSLFSSFFISMPQISLTRLLQRFSGNQEQPPLGIDEDFVVTTYLFLLDC